MKSKLKSILGAGLVGGLLLVVAGCVTTSVYPFYTEKDVAFDAKLVGRWGEKADAADQYWDFVQDRTNSTYMLTIVEKEKRTKYWIHLFRLKQWTFLDGESMESCEGMLSPHYLARVVQIEPTLKLQLLNNKWLEDQLEQNPRALRHIKKPGQYDGHLVLTAETAELQKFLLKHMGNTNLFSEEMEPLVRVK